MTLPTRLAFAIPLAFALLAACGAGPVPPSMQTAAGTGTVPAPAVTPATGLALAPIAAPAPPPPNPTPPWTPTEPPAAAMGTAAPTLVQAVAPDGRWAVLCQARTDTNHDGRLRVDIGMHGDPYGDALVPYFVEGSGPGTPIDDLLDADPTGRFVLLLLRGQPVLRDTTTGMQSVLRGDPSPVAFGDGGEALFYVRTHGTGHQLIVRTLETGKEAAIDPGPGQILRLEPYPRAQAIRIVAKLPDPLGRKDVSHSNLYRGRCAGRASSSYHWGITHSMREQRMVSLKDGRVRVVPEEVRPFLHGWLRTLADGSTRFEAFDETGPAATEAKRPGGSLGHGAGIGPTCGKVIFADPLRGRLVAACPEGQGFGLHLFGEGAPRLLTTLERPVDQHVAPFGRHLLISVRDADDLVVDVDAAAGEPRLSPTYQRLVAIRGDTTLVQRGEQLVLLDGANDRVLTKIPSYPRVFGVHHRATGEANRIVLVDTVAVDLARGEVVGVVPDEPPLMTAGGPMGSLPYHPFGFTRDGWVLVESAPPRGARTVSDVGLGPMRWTKLVTPAAK